MICPYCNKEAKWCENKEIYGKNYGKSFMCYFCKGCDAYVGCHENSKNPLGTMADRELRQWRIRTHNEIDVFWKGKNIREKEKSSFRKALYRKLEIIFGKKIHVGESDIEQCKKIIQVVHNHPSFTTLRK